MQYTWDRATRPGVAWQPGLIGGVFADQGLCGRSMNSGLLRFHDAGSAPAAQATVNAMLGTRGLDAEVFAFDWLARQFSVTSCLTAEGLPDRTRTSRTVVVLDPFDGSVTPWVDARSFERALGVPLAQDFLMPDLFGEWKDLSGIADLPFDACAGARVPGFYGGKRQIANLNLDSVEVYLIFHATALGARSRRRVWFSTTAFGSG
ncbi:hypothetical protein DE4585_02626 [Mycobacteroides salmoniphilum]|uniref:Uncharacterized protein n=1 Tax=Mycobacteroides salmoniphilum TaxID=404941 RepID=A0A4R8S3A4_9MYCO|nr:hypothetical protein [Mycobacteroides salmoniphilum]TDZ82097.1 hypothetical protein DE4585_02626 [Mycobacteroides salmoniphilum]